MATMFEKESSSNSTLQSAGFKTVTYVGKRVARRCVVIRIDEKEARPLPLRTDLQSHSPEGFEWGREGKGQIQLAIALLADAVDENTAIKCCGEFQKRVLEKLPYDVWQLTTKDIVQQSQDLYHGEGVTK